MSDRCKSEFVERLSADYRQYCASNEVAETPEGLIQFMVDRDFVPDCRVRALVVLRAHPEAYARNGNFRKATVMDLARDYGISERTVFTILDRSSSKCRFRRGRGKRKE